MAAFILLVLATLSVLQVTEGKPKVLLVSMDGFRHDYLKKAKTPNFDSMISAGVTMPYMNNSFVTNTFPCHYTMATGLYSESHGIVANKMYDPDLNKTFTMSSTESHWWEQGEPIWITARKAGLKAGVFFWPGSEAAILGVRPDQWKPYNNSTPYDLRVTTVVSWLSKDDFDLGVLYFSEPDSTGHSYGPDSNETVHVIEQMDGVLGKIVQELDDAGLKGKVNLIVTSDHGMADVDVVNKVIDLSQLVNSSLLHSVVDDGATCNMRPQPGKDAQLVEALRGIPHMHVMLKEDIPDRFHLKHNRRVMPVFAYAEEGWTISANASARRKGQLRGSHGYDNDLLSMKPIFVARGPSFKSGKTVSPIRSVDIYPLICHILQIKPAPNNGSLDRAATLLIHSPNSQSKLTTNLFILTLVTVCVYVMATADR